jgi:hypothetical protein
MAALNPVFSCFSSQWGSMATSVSAPKLRWFIFINKQRRSEQLVDDEHEHTRRDEQGAERQRSVVRH